MARIGQCPVTEGGKGQAGVMYVVTTAETWLVHSVPCKRGHGCQLSTIAVLMPGINPSRAQP